MIRSTELVLTASLPTIVTICVAEDGKPSRPTPSARMIHSLSEARVQTPSPRPPSESNSQTGKLESMPPSTITWFSPVFGFSNTTGSKKIGMLMLIRTASATSSSSGSIPRRPASRGRTRSSCFVTSDATTCRL